MKLTKKQLIDGIIKAQGKNHAERSYLNTRTVAQLEETYRRWVSISKLTQSEISRHCDVSFIK